MSLNIWQECDGKRYVTPLNEKVWRIVEAQERVSTRKLVNSLDEQILLEQMIEEVKPMVPADCDGLHQLLFTPFRYPPLLHGSRFGRRHERCLWYGSRELKTAMLETAFYRFNFFDGCEANFGVVATQLTAFASLIRTDSAAILLDEPFSKFSKIISSPVDYKASQELGSCMREAGINAFNYYSARDPDAGVNIALFTPSAFENKMPVSDSFQSWQCITDHRVVEFMRTSAIKNEVLRFSLDMFLVDGRLPFPAF